MKKPIQVNIVLSAMLFLFSAYLVVKGTMGIEEHRQTALWVLLLGTPIGIFIAVFHSLDQKLPLFLKRLPGLFKHRWFLKYDLVLILVLSGIALVDILYISTFKNLLEDETALIHAVQLFITNGKDYFFNHYAEIPWLGRQHPPLPVLLVGDVANFFGLSAYFPARMMSILLGLGTGLCTYLIARQLYDRKIACFAVILLFAIRHFNLAQVSFNNDIFVTFFFTLIVFFVLQLKAAENNPFFQRFGWAVMIGITLGLGLLSKYTMVFAYLMLLPIVHWPFSKATATPNFFAYIWASQRSNMALLLVCVLFSLLVFSVWVDYLFRSGVINYQASTLLYYMGRDVDQHVEEIKVIQNGYFSEWRLKFFLGALVYRIPSGFGFYSLPLIGLGIWTWIRQRNNGENINSNRFIGYWLAIIFIPVLIALPVNRYFMPAFPALAIFMAVGLKDFYKTPIRILLLALVLSYSMVIVYFS